MKTMLTIVVIAIGLALPGYTQETSEGRNLAELSFDSVDQNEDGYVDKRESNEFGGSVFVSMDDDNSGQLSEDEFLEWGYGFQNIAEEENKELAYRTALRVVFSFWDRDGNGEVSRPEQSHAAMQDFDRADLNGDALLSETEFIGGFSIMVAIRAALKP